MRGMCTENNITLSLLWAEKIMFPTKPDVRTDGRRDISNYRVDSPLKTNVKD